MHTIRPGRVAALLAVLALLLAAIPAAAAPPMTDRPVESATGARAPLVHALADWLTALWSGFGPQAVWEKLGSVADPDGAPESSASVPTATPQLGPDGNSDG